MQQSKDKDEAGSKTATDEEIQDLVAQTLLLRRLKKHAANRSASNSKPSPTSTGKKPIE